MGLVFVWVEIFCGLFLHFAWVILVFLLKPDGTRLKMSETEFYLSVFVHFRPKSFLPLLFPVRLWAVQVWTVQIWPVRPQKVSLPHYLHHLKIGFQIYFLLQKLIQENAPEDALLELLLELLLAELLVSISPDLAQATELPIIFSTLFNQKIEQFSTLFDTISSFTFLKRFFEKRF